MNTSVVVREVGLRDGLQSIATVLPTALKIEWINAAYAAGQREIEVGSFVPAKLLPQLADTAALVAHAKTLPGLIASVLVPNLKGAERAIEVGAHSILIPMSASRAHSAANVRKTPEEMLATIAAIRAARDAVGSKTRIEVGMSTAFGCTLQGDVPEADVIAFLQGALDAGAECVSLADTVGYADPGQVRRLFERALRAVGERLTCAHFHDTRGLALANTLIALDLGIRRFDASTAGIGGCPHAPGASGNAATEDVVFMLTRMGYDTGINLDALLALRKQIAEWLTGEQLGGAIWRAGVPSAGARVDPSMPSFSP
ncbi:MAG: hydroxymethylglutaryl-CoA lyase [Burkholderiales bacterium]|nr:hydroxymethylglutaryl-CoA lyase [Burkholderiales bacterium]